MSCERMESRILGYVDGRLKESERLELEKHLTECAPCCLRVSEFTAVSGLLDELPRIAFAASMLFLMTLWLGYRTGTSPTPNIPNDDQAMMQDLPVLEDHDVLQNFEPLKDLPPGPEDDDGDAQQPQRM